MKFFVTNPNNDFAETPVQEEGRIIHVGIMLENQKIFLDFLTTKAMLTPNHLLIVVLNQKYRSQIF